ncbi:MAG: YraN family protein [Deltaproteobacteria bacterium]|nr:MAG: YraN family protein [Deltaproteobacteria bacterium]
MTLQKKELGANGEELAARYLMSQGYRILERNYRIRLGEIDIIAEQGKDLVFIEVKTRSDTLFGSPLDSVTIPKQRQLSKVALEYMSRQGCHNRPARFDVVGVQLKGLNAQQLQNVNIELVQNAFDLCYGNE